MELILWRHAEAGDGLPDATRKLTDKGLRQAQVMAEWLKTKLPKNTRVLVSPSKRTQQTASALGSNYETTTEVGIGASAKSILVAAGWPGAKTAVVVVGHQPTLGEVASLLLSGTPSGRNIRKGTVWWFSHKGKAGATDVILRAVISPDML